MNQTEKSLKNGLTRFSLALPVFGFCMLFTVFIWEAYVDPASNLHLFLFIFGAGFFFSAAVALFVYALELNQIKLQRELKENEDKLKEFEAKLKVDDHASSAICWLSQIMFAEQNPSQLLESAIDLITKVLRADDGSIMLLGEGGDLYIGYSSGMPEQIAQNVRVKIGERIAGRVAQKKREYLITGSLTEHPEFSGLENNPKIGSSIVCPLMLDDKVLGVMCLNRSQGQPDFTESYLRYALIYAAQVAQVLHNAEVENIFLREGVELKNSYQNISRRLSA